MSFGAPLALSLGLLAVPLVLLYLLKPRREELVVPSTFLWSEALEEVQANAPWQRLRRNLLLLLQLLILALLVLALARPLLASSVAPGGDLVLLLDTSQSMSATDRTPSRFAVARDRARQIAQEAGVGSRVALVSAGPTPRLVAGPTADESVLYRALSGLQEPHGTSNLRDAAILARSVAGRLKDPTIILVGDGGASEGSTARVPYPVRFDSVGGEGANAGILSLSARSGLAGRQLWASLGNWGPARTATLSLSVDGELFDARPVELPENGVTGVEVGDLPRGTVVEARLDAQDALAADNVAWYVDSEGAATRVLLHGEESRFLERALSLLPNVEVFESAPGAAPEPGYDVYVINGAVPAQLPPGNLLLLAPSNSGLLPVTGVAEGLAVTAQSQDNVLLRFVDLGSTSVARASRLAPADWMETLASSGDVPLLVAGEHDGRRVAALAFAPEQSDLPLQVAFPLLVDNLVNFLQPRAAAGPGAVAPGSAVGLPDFEGEMVVLAPDGRSLPVSQGAGAFSDTVEPGVYEVRAADGSRVLARFAVNAGSLGESNLAAATQVPLVTEGAPTADVQRPAGAERWWPLAAVALAVLGLEWWLYTRSQQRTRVRRAA